MRAVACGIFAVAVACAAPRAAPPRAKLPPRAAAPETDAAPRFPEAGQVWGAQQYRAFVRALDRSVPKALPKAGDPLFERVVAEQNLAAIRDRNRALFARLVDLRDVMRSVRATSERYFEALTAGERLDAEFLRVHAFHVGLVWLTWELIEEADEGDGHGISESAWRAARAEIPRATAGLLIQVATILGHRDVHAAENLAMFVDRSKRPLRGLFRRVSPAAQLSLIDDLRRLARVEADAAFAARLSALATELDAADIAIGVSELRMGAKTVIGLPKKRERGFDAVHKRSGPNDLFIVPLASAIEAAQLESPLVIDVEPTTPTRVVLEVAFTLGQSRITRWRLRSTANPARQLRVRMPRRAGPSFELLALVTSKGIGLKTPAGNMLPGCAGIGVGLAVPKRAGQHDWPALAACVQRMGVGEPLLGIAADPSVSFAELLSVATALPHPAGDVPDVALLIAR